MRVTIKSVRDAQGRLIGIERVSVPESSKATDTTVQIASQKQVTEASQDERVAAMLKKYGFSGGRFRHVSTSSRDTFYKNGRKVCRHGGGASGGVYNPENFLSEHCVGIVCR